MPNVSEQQHAGVVTDQRFVHQRRQAKAGAVANAIMRTASMKSCLIVFPSFKGLRKNQTIRLGGQVTSGKFVHLSGCPHAFPLSYSGIKP